MKKVLIVDLCYEESSLHYNEFVLPVVDIVKSCKVDYEVVHFMGLDDVCFDDFDKVILCGVALKDFEYLEHLDKFEWIEVFSGDVLGICAGCQVIGKLFGAQIASGKEIGMRRVEVVCNDVLFEKLGAKELDEVYCLHQSFCDVPNGFELVLKSEEYPLMFRKGCVCGVLFHPEVRNKKLIENFII